MRARDDADRSMVVVWQGGLAAGVNLKSYLLEELDDEQKAREALTELLPGQTEPWLIPTSGGDDVVAYLNLWDGVDGETGGPVVIHADMSGRHHHEHETVIALLRRLQERLGGTVRTDNDGLIS